MLWFLNFSSDFYIAFNTYATLLGVLLILNGVILAGCAHAVLSRKHTLK
jgi:hypothetical protein